MAETKVSERKRDVCNSHALKQSGSDKVIKTDGKCSALA